MIDEAILLFRPNAYYRNFELLGPADRTLAYLLLFIGDCLTKLKATGMDVAEASRTLANFATNGFSIPGDNDFPLKAMFAAPSSRSEAGSDI
jgi:actin related protein 2/3 complex subunit 3